MVYQTGEEFDATEEHARFLMADSPGSFERVKALNSPPAHKAILEPRRAKAQQPDDLTVISGISNAKARQLALMGVDSFVALAAASVDDLMDIRGVGEATAQAWIEEARERA